MNYAVDTDLIKGALQRRRGCATGLIAKYRGLVMAQFAGIVKDREDARELTQDSFAQAFSSLAALRDMTRFPGWLRTIARRVLRAWRRTSRRRLDDLSQSVKPADLAQIVLDPTSTVDETLVKKEIWEDVDGLPEPYRSTLLKRYRQGLKLGEIATADGIGLSLVKFRVSHAVRMLRRRLARAARVLRTADW